MRRRGRALPSSESARSTGNGVPVADHRPAHRNDGRPNACGGRGASRTHPSAAAVGAAIAAAAPALRPSPPPPSPPLPPAASASVRTARGTNVVAAADAMLAGSEAGATGAGTGRAAGTSRADVPAPAAPRAAAAARAAAKATGATARRE